MNAEIWEEQHLRLDQIFEYKMSFHGPHGYYEYLEARGIAMRQEFRQSFGEDLKDNFANLVWDWEGVFDVFTAE